MQQIYDHTQTGTTMLFFLGIPIIGVVAAVLLTSEPSALLPLFIIVAFMLATMLVFK